MVDYIKIKDKLIDKKFMFFFLKKKKKLGSIPSFFLNSLLAVDY